MIKTIPSVREIYCDRCGIPLAQQGAEFPKFNIWASPINAPKCASLPPLPYGSHGTAVRASEYALTISSAALRSHHSAIYGENPYSTKEGPADLCPKCVAFFLESLLSKLKAWEAGKAEHAQWLADARALPEDYPRKLMQASSTGKLD